MRQQGSQQNLLVWRDLQLLRLLVVASRCVPETLFSTEQANATAEAVLIATTEEHHSKAMLALTQGFPSPFVKGL